MIFPFLYLFLLVVAALLGPPDFHGDMCLFGLTGLAAATLGSGIINGIGNIFSTGSNAYANAQNIKMQRETNDLQYKMFQEGNEFNQSERLATQEYNSAQAQRMRLEEAGLNPYLMMNGGNAGTAEAASSVPAPAVNAPQITGLGNPVQGVQEMMLRVAQADQIQASADLDRAQAKQIGVATEQQKTELDIMRQQLPALLERAGLENKQIEAIIRTLDAQWAKTETETSYIGVREKSLIDLTNEQARKTAADATIAEINAIFQERLNDKQLEIMRASLARIWSEVGKNIAERGYVDAQTEATKWTNKILYTPGGFKLDKKGDWEPMYESLYEFMQASIIYHNNQESWSASGSAGFETGPVKVKGSGSYQEQKGAYVRKRK